VTSSGSPTLRAGEQRTKRATWRDEAIRRAHSDRAPLWRIGRTVGRSHQRIAQIVGDRR